LVGRAASMTNYMRTTNPKTTAAMLLGFLLLTISLRAAAPDATSVPATPGVDSLAAADPAQIKAFFASADYAKLHRDDAEFIQDVYQGILRRAPDAAGREAWLKALKSSADHAGARAKLVDSFLESSEYIGLRATSGAAKVVKKDTARNPGNSIFNTTGVFVNDAAAFPASRYKSKLKMGKVAWIALQIDNGGKVRADNAAAIESGWAAQWRAAGFKVGFWGCPRGVAQHGKQSAVDQAIPLVQADAGLAVHLAAKYSADLYLADLEDPFQSYNATDPAPLLNRVYVERFKSAAAAAGIGKLPRALSSCGRIALDMKPWIDEGWDAMPQAYWNSYAVYQPSHCVDFYTQAGWPIERVHPTIATYAGEGENRTVTLQDYAGDLKTTGSTGFSYYLPESYLKMDDSGYKQLARMGAN
jgi:hypothetical protein